MSNISFIKMHGLGNDFVILDARHDDLTLTPRGIRRIADRRQGVGCDQLIVLEQPATHDVAALRMRIFNADGSEVGACGNATRCIVWLHAEETGEASCQIETEAGLLHGRRVGDRQVTVNMGPPKLDWQDIPLSDAMDTRYLPLKVSQYPELEEPVGVSMGNPHAIFFVHDVSRYDLQAIGPELEHAPLFPERANISLAEVVTTKRLRLRTWERGAGETPACGTAACAALVAAVRRGFTEREALLELPGGSLTIHWESPSDQSEPGAADSVWMTGPVVKSFTGVLRGALLEGQQV